MFEILTQLKSEGFEVSEVIPDGKIHRFKDGPKDDKKSGFYVAYRNFLESTGQEFYVIVYGSWRLGEPKTYCTLKGHLSKADQKSVEKKIAELKKREQEEREKQQSIIAAEVEQLWNASTERGISEYLRRKQITECPDLGIRFDGDAILIPARDVHGRLWSFQRVVGSGEKRFHAGGRVLGCFHSLGNPEESRVVYICEGFATAASVRLATGSAVVCCFTANNLTPVAKSIKGKFPNKCVVVAGDDDCWKEGNAGRTKGELAAKACLGRAVFPTFVSTDSKPTDWNDLHVLEGIDAVKAQLSEVKQESSYLVALGFKEKEYFFTSSSNQQIIPISAFSKTDFLNLMPIDYWETLFPGAGAQRVSWDDATTALMMQARAKGIFQSQNIRGAGVWNDEGRIVVNMGDHLLVDGERVGLGDIRSRFFYTIGIRLPALNQNPLTVEECNVVREACGLFKWKKPDFGFLLAGAMVTTRVCGALPIRPHLWLTGEKGSGKTTLFNRLIYPLIGEPLIFAGGNTTEAGIRQEVSANAVPVLFDEFENNGKKSEEAIQSILDLMRLSWSETKASIIKGSAGGTATSYRARFAAIVTSIRQVSMSDADRSRFATIELGPHGSDAGHWKKLEAHLDQIDDNFGNRLFARTIGLLPVLLENFRVMKLVMGRSASGQRFADQYGMLLAGYATLLQDEPICEEQAEVMLKHVKLEEEKEDASISDHETALTHLSTTIISYDHGETRASGAIGTLIVTAWRDSTLEHMRKGLLNIGIRVESEFVAVANTNAELEKQVFRGTRWSNSWSNSLSRLHGATRKKTRIGPKAENTVRIPISLFQNNENDQN